MKLAVYVLCYDDASEAAANQAFAQHDWATVTRLPDDPASNKYMEGAAYLKTLHDSRADWQGADLVGVLSYKAPCKISVDLLRKACEETRGADVVAFLSSLEPLLCQAVQSHPRFLEVWVPLLLHLGYDACDVVHAHMPAFFCNYWLATPAWMDKFLGFYARVHNALETLPCIQEPLWSDTTYRNNLPAERCMQIYGRPYIPHHPFVCERLPCFFFWKEQAAIALVPLGTKQFWHEYYETQVMKVCHQARLTNEHLQPQ